MASNLQTHTITAFYESRPDADAAAAKLRQSGVPATDVIVSPDDARDDAAFSGDAASTRTKTGFWASLEDMFGGTEDHHVYAEGLRRGHVLLTASVTDAQLDRAIAILEEHGSIDLDQHEESWRNEGWTSASTRSTAGIGTAEVVGDAMALGLTNTGPTTRVADTRTVVAETPVSTPVSVATSTTPVVAQPATNVGRGADDVLQVVEERLDVGKRAVSRGKVRLHSYVVENQVSEDVNLRDETVTVDRRVVDRPVAALGADAFQERTIEMEEFDEEAVVAKTAHVVEEIGIRKDVTDRVETVRDTVRSTKVDVEDTRTQTGTAGARGIVEGSDGGRIVEHMEVYASDGTKVGTVDHMDGPDRIKLAKSTSPDGQHHLVPMTWVDHVDQHVHLNRTVAEMKASPSV